MPDLRIHLIQTDQVWENPSQNLIEIEKLMPTTAVDLIILPEMFSTGFSMNIHSLAEEMNGPTHRWMKEMAARTAATLCGSLIIKEKNKFYNRMLWVTSEGETEYYDKKNLFSPGEENKYYTPGHRRKVVKLKGWKINLQICYDLRFPIWCSNNNDFDLQIFIASWPHTRALHFEILSRARAIENQAYVIALNRCGSDGNALEYKGKSQVISPQGDILLELGNQASSGSMTISKENLKNYRKIFPFWKDGYGNPFV